MSNLRCVLVAFAAVMMVSCTTSFKMITTLERDGTARRDLYAWGDSAYMAGNSSKSPFLFEINSDWKVDRFGEPAKMYHFGDSLKFNTMVSKSARSISQFSEEILCDDDMRSLVAPQESVSKTFRWFYTNYSFRAVYHKLKIDTSIPLDRYLSKDEQRLWLQGDHESLKGLNGFEINSILSGIESRFIEWYSRNYFELSLKVVMQKTTEYPALNQDKEKIYTKLFKESTYEDISPEILCAGLDKFYKTTYFSELGRSNRVLFETEFEQSTSGANIIGNEIVYELRVGGAILSSNADSVSTEALIWKVDGMRILADDYTLTAEYRTPNVWAFILTGLLIAAAVACSVYCYRRK